MIRYGSLFIALLLAAMNPQPAHSHSNDVPPDHDLSTTPELAEIDFENDWVAYGLNTGNANRRTTFPDLYQLLFPLVYVSGSPYQQNFGSSPQAVMFATATEQSIEGMFDGTGTPQNKKIVAKRAGTYEFIATFGFTIDNMEAYEYRMEIQKYDQGNEFVETCGKDARNDLTLWRGLHARGIVELNVGDYLKMYVDHDRGSTVEAGSGTIFMQRIGPLAPQNP